MKYKFTEEEKEFILHCLSEEKREEATNKINNLRKNKKESLINDYYFDLLYDVQNEIYDEDIINEQDYDEVGKASLRLQEIYSKLYKMLDRNSISFDDSNRIFDKADQIFDQIEEIKKDILKDKKQAKKKIKKISKIMEKISK